MTWLLLFPAVVVVAILMMLSILARDWLRRLSCRHANVRLVRQQRGESIYFAEVCMDCRKASRARP